MKIIGIVPARMAASRFPGKPLHPINGRPMIEHVFERAKLYKKWDGLFLATCDKEIEDFGLSKSYPTVMTSNKHTRCLDRVAEAVEKCGIAVGNDDIVVCVQGDEPLLDPNMVEAAIKPLMEDKTTNCTVVAMHITEESQFVNPDTVKIVWDSNGDVLYTSRAPVPYAKKFSADMEARRIYGIFAFRWPFLKKFNAMEESRLERLESCDSNRICGNGLKQRIAPYPYKPSFSVDSPSDIGLVEAAMAKDAFFGAY